MDIALEMQPELRQWVSPRLIEANHILSLSLQELEQTIMTEIEENPALELEEEATCPLCGNRMESRFCPTCAVDQRPLDAPRTREEDYEPAQAVAGGREDDFDPMTLIASETSLIDRILSDVATLIPAADLPIAEYLLNNLDERGYLEVDLAAVADLVGRPVVEIEAILAAVQQVAPVGVAARDMRECLLLQMTYLDQQEQPAPAIVRRIVADHLEDLAAHKYGHIGRKLGLATEDVHAARDFIRANLNPFPLQNQEARWWKTPTRAPYASPDVIITLRDGEFHVEIVESAGLRLRLNPLYSSLAGALSRNGKDYSAADRTHIRQYVNRARLFVSNIRQRHDTLRKITECLLELQGDFIRNGVRELKPLTRAQVAERVGVHESTVSRATADKYLMLPSRQVISFSAFFTASLSVKDVIKEMIDKEDGALTDQEICRRLRAQGYRIARRTIAKYRAQLGILPSTLR
jgi:RNA polymerase sigma-54 factor